MQDIMACVPETEKIIDMIAGLLDPAELNYFTLKVGDEVIDFKRRMMSRYGNCLPIYSLEVSREKALRIIETHRPVIVPNSNLHTIFLDKFLNILFFYF